VSVFYLPFALAQIYLQLHYLPPPTNGAKTCHPVHERRETNCVTVKLMFERPSNLLRKVSNRQLIGCYVGRRLRCNAHFPLRVQGNVVVEREILLSEQSWQQQSHYPIDICVRALWAGLCSKRLKNLHFG